MSEASVAFALLRASTQLVEAIQTHLAAAGFQDVRPAHGFVFVRVSKGAAHRPTTPARKRHRRCGLANDTTSSRTRDRSRDARANPTRLSEATALADFKRG